MVVNPTILRSILHGTNYDRRIINAENENSIKKNNQIVSSNPVPTELDFFGYNTTIMNASNAKNNKKNSQNLPVKLTTMDNEQKRKAIEYDETIKNKKIKSKNEAEDKYLIDKSQNQNKNKNPKKNKKKLKDDEKTENLQLFATDNNEINKTNKDLSNSSLLEKKEKEITKQKEINYFRSKLKIYIHGKGNLPNPVIQFDEMKLFTKGKNDKNLKLILKNIEISKYKEPTPIQMQSIPVILEGRDMVGTAPTGSGKTAAFIIPILLKTSSIRNKKNNNVKALILAPTRELAKQIYDETKKLAENVELNVEFLCNDKSENLIAKDGLNSLDKTKILSDIVITTPMRAVHLIKQKKLDLSNAGFVCLDEADLLFEMGLIDQIDEILAACSNPKIQRIMFSATMLQGVGQSVDATLRDPVKVFIGTKNTGAESIKQKLLFVGKEKGKLLEMKQLIQQGLHVPALIFVQNKERAQELYGELVYDGINIEAIHSDKSKEMRDKITKNFKNGKIWVLICTDLMSRGMDFKDVNLVINYDFPQSAISYIHRIGRTGRCGKKGTAITFFTESDMVYLRSIANVMRLSGCDVPEWMLNLKKQSIRKRKALLKAPPSRYRIKTISGYDLKKMHKKKMIIKKNQEKTDKKSSSSSTK